jgi:hypothetical protein
MWSDSQWAVLLGGNEAFEGGSVKEEACSPVALLSRFGPCGLFFFVPEVVIYSERSPISGRVPELEITLGVIYKQWSGVL